MTVRPAAHGPVGHNHDDPDEADGDDYGNEALWAATSLNLTGPRRDDIDDAHGQGPEWLALHDVAQHGRESGPGMRAIGTLGELVAQRPNGAMSCVAQFGCCRARIRRDATERCQLAVDGCPRLRQMIRDLLPQRLADALGNIGFLHGGELLLNGSLNEGIALLGESPSSLEQQGDGEAPEGANEQRGDEAGQGS